MDTPLIFAHLRIKGLAQIGICERVELSWVDEFEVFADHLKVFFHGES
jgi:hypothetical protein